MSKRNIELDRIAVANSEMTEQPPKGKKILFTASTKSHIENFHIPYLKAFEEMGWSVDAVALPVSKSFFSIKNLGAINYTRKLLKEGNYDVISSHATLAGIVTRLGVMLNKKAVRSKMNVFHTAHGYLFHDDKSLKKWAYLLPEIICSKVTDVLMVMNHEDLEIAKKYKLCKTSENIHYINGMGIDLSRFQTVDGVPLQCTKEQRQAFGIADDDFVFVYAAEFSKRKNHELLLRGFAEVVKQLEQGAKQSIKSANNALNRETEISERTADQNNSLDQKEINRKKKNLKLVLAGDGVLLEEMKTLSENLGISDRVIFLGYIKNVHELYPCCDVAVSTSKIEGLPFNIMEAMACGLPVIASDIKGHRELITTKESCLFKSQDQLQLSELLEQYYKEASTCNRFAHVVCNGVEKFSLNEVMPTIMRLYLQYKS